MKRITNLFLFATVAMAVSVSLGAVTIMMICSCPGSSTAYADEISTDENEKAPEKDKDETAEADSGDDESGKRIITCWGDSLTEGIGASPASIVKDGVFFNASFQSYPEILEKLTGITTINYGISGATSEEIVFLQKALLQLREIDGAGASSVRDPRQEGDVLILEFGSNGGWEADYDTLIEQYRNVIERSGCDNYIIIGDTDDPGTSIADEKQKPMFLGRGTAETEWETALRQAFGDHFINMRVFLVEEGLETAGLKATMQDRWDTARGCVSEQLRSDWTHLNSFGYYAKAVAVYQKGQDLGYW